MRKPCIYNGLLHVEKDGHVHIKLDGGKFLCLNRHDLDGARVEFSVISTFETDSLKTVQ